VKLNFTGGEPLLRRDAVDLMAYANQRGIRSLHLNTNGILLDSARRHAVLEAGVVGRADAEGAAGREACAGSKRRCCASCWRRSER